jgi:hypothetical protein
MSFRLSSATLIEASERSSARRLFEITWPNKRGFSRASAIPTKRFTDAVSQLTCECYLRQLYTNRYMDDMA